MFSCIKIPPVKYCLCIFRSDSKPGQCPPVSPDAKAECPPAESTSGCLLDSDCEGTKKCCTDGCTLVCTTVKQPPAPKVLKGEPGDPGEPGPDVRSPPLFLHFLLTKLSHDFFFVVLLLFLDLYLFILFFKTRESNWFKSDVVAAFHAFCVVKQKSEINFSY